MLIDDEDSHFRINARRDKLIEKLEEVKKIENEIKERLDEIRPLLKKIFENDKEYEYSLEIVKQIINNIYSELYEYEPQTDIVGHKRKVLNYLRENDFLQKGTKGYDSKVYYVTCLDSNVKDENQAFGKIKKSLQNLFDRKIKEAKSNTQKRYICSTCEYKWETKKQFGEPFKCPRCNSQNIISFEKLKKMISKK